MAADGCEMSPCQKPVALVCGLAVWIAPTDQVVSRSGDPPLLTFRVCWGLRSPSAPAFQLRQCLINFALSKNGIVHESAASGQPMELRNSLKAMVGFLGKNRSLLSAHLSQNETGLFQTFSGSQEVKRNGLFKNPLAASQQSSKKTKPAVFLFDISQFC